MLKVSSCEYLICRKWDLEAFEKQIFLLVFNWKKTIKKNRKAFSFPPKTRKNENHSKNWLSGYILIFSQKLTKNKAEMRNRLDNAFISYKFYYIIFEYNYSKKERGNSMKLRKFIIDFL